jgi:hypothetical protein
VLLYTASVKKLIYSYMDGGAKDERECGFWAARSIEDLQRDEAAYGRVELVYEVLE